MISIPLRAHTLLTGLLLTAAVGCSANDGKGKTSPDTDSGAQLGPEPALPPVPDVCPPIQSSNGIIDLFGARLELFVGEKQTDKKGPVFFYWHGTGSTSTAEIPGFMQPIVNEIVSEGGVVASFETTSGLGDNTGNFVWYTGDYDVADKILACADQQLNIDKRRIYAGGCSAGGLQSGGMVLARSSYLAGAMPNSGGTILVREWQDTSHIPAVITVHGDYGNDNVILHFVEWSLFLGQEVATKGGDAVNCQHGNGHCMIFPPSDGDPQAVDPLILIPELTGVQWQFLKDHPFGYQQDPYADGLPSSFPSYCKPVIAGSDR